MAVRYEDWDKKRLIAELQTLERRVRAMEGNRLSTEVPSTSRLLESVRESVMAKDLDGRITYWGKGAEALFGYTAAEVMGKQRVFSLPEEDAAAQDRFEQALKDGEWRGVYRQRKKEGDVFWSDVQISLIKNDDGRPTGFVGIDRDVSDRILADQALRSSEQKYTALKRVLPDAIFRLTGDGWFTDFIPAEGFVPLASPEFFISRRLEEILPAAVAERLQAAVTEALDTHALKSVTYPLHEGTELHHYEARVVPESEDQVLALVRDVTEARQAEEALRRSEARLRSITDSMTEYMLELDREGNILFTNRTPPGRAAEGVLGQPIYAVLPESVRNRARTCIEGVVASGTPGSFDSEYVLQDEAVRYFESSVSPVFEDGELTRVVVLSRDISARRRAEVALIESETRLRMLMEQAPFGIQIFDHDGTLLQVNRGWEEIWEAQGEEVVGSYNALQDEQTERMGLRDHIRRVFDGEYVRFPDLHFDPSESGVPGKMKWVRTRAFPIRGVNESFNRAVVISEDITENKASEDAAQRSEQDFRRLMEESPVGIQLYDPNGTLLAVNRAWERIWNVRGEDVVNRYNVLQDKQVEKIGRLKLIQRAFQGETIEVERDYYDPAASGMEGKGAWIHAYQYPLHDVQGNLRRVVVLTEDITERVESEEAIRASEEKFARAFSASPDIMVITTVSNSCIVDVNESFERYSGYSREECVGKPWGSLQVSPSIEDQERMEVLLAANGRAREVEMEIENRNGERFNFLVSAEPITFEGQHHLLTVLRDITRQKEYERALLQARQEAEELMLLKSSFLANMSHEIRTPLTSILGFASILSEEVPEDLQHLTQPIERSGRRLLDTLNSVLDLIRLQADRVDMQPDLFEINGLVEDTVHLLEPLVTQTDLEMEFVPSSEKAWAHLDAAYLHRILNNLIGNAVKFTEAGSVTVRVELASEEVKVHVEDTGIGIDPAFLPHLFDEFRQGSVGVARTHEGSGLGLSITRNLVDLMHGRIEVKSEIGVGSVFTVVLERADAEQHAERDATAGHPLVSPEVRRARLLVVEDSAETRLLVERMLGDWYDVSSAPDARTALDMARAHPFSLVLLDINLGPGQDGINLLKVLRQYEPYRTVPIVALTAYALPGDRERFLGLGFDDYVAKPFTKEELLNALVRFPS